MNVRNTFLKTTRYSYFACGFTAGFICAIYCGVTAHPLLEQPNTQRCHDDKRQPKVQSAFCLSSGRTCCAFSFLIVSWINHSSEKKDRPCMVFTDQEYKWMICQKCCRRWFNFCPTTARNACGCRGNSALLVYLNNG